MPKGLTERPKPPHSARKRGETAKALKGCGGKQEFSPMSHILSYKRRSSETVRWTVSEVSGTDFFDKLDAPSILGRGVFYCDMSSVPESRSASSAASVTAFSILR